MNPVRSSFPIMLATTAFLAAPFVHAKKNRAILTPVVFTLNNRNGQPGDTVRDLGKKIFYTTCYTCHKDTADYLAPGYSVLSLMTPRAVLAALDNGKMRQQAASLSENERIMGSILTSSICPSISKCTTSLCPNRSFSRSR